MHDRKQSLARVIAQSIGPDGTPDRAAIYSALQVTPDDPVTLIVEAVLAADASFVRLQDAQGQHLVTLQAEFQAGSRVFADALEKHVGRLEVAYAEAARLVEAISRAKAEAGEEIQTKAEIITAAASALFSNLHLFTEAAEKFNAHIRVFSNRALFAVFGVGAVTGILAAVAVLTFRH